MGMPGLCLSLVFARRSNASFASASFATGSSLQIRPGVAPMRQPAPQRRRSRQVVQASISSNDFRPGVSIEMDGAPWRVMEFLHVKPGKGAAFVRTKLKNYISGAVLDKTFRAGESVGSATIEKTVKQFTYMEGDQFVFMDTQSFEETRLPKDDYWSKFLKEGMDVSVMSWNGKVIGVEPPPTVVLEVTDTDPGIKGNTASGGSKPATVETGAVISVPLFVNIGDKISIDTRNETYLSRAT